MPNHHDLTRALLVAIVTAAVVLTGCFARPEQTETACITLLPSQTQCDEDYPSESTGESEVVAVGPPTRERLNTYRCTYAVSIRHCTGTTTCGPSDTELPIEHTTITIPIGTEVCPAPGGVGPLLQSTRSDIEIVSVDAAGKLEAVLLTRCCYQVTYEQSGGLNS